MQKTGQLQQKKILYYLVNPSTLFIWYCPNFCEKSLLRWRIVVNLAPYTPKNLPAAAGEPPRRSCFALGGFSRFSGDLALRHSAGLRLAHALRMVVGEFYYSTLPRRSFSGDGSFSFALIDLQPCRTIHPPIANDCFYS